MAAPPRPLAEIANQAQWQGADQEHGKQEAGHEARLGRRNDVWVLMVRIQQWSVGRLNRIAGTTWDVFQ